MELTAFVLVMQPFLAIYGGDIAREHAPDLGWLMSQVHQRYNCHLMAVQSAGTPDEHTDYCFV